ncbi:MAG: 7-carboxy-7-deazaguanine synthase QueE [Pseudomonadota bacterium]|nr:7-carboxy-7-deazaguanine synthase QueE [Pseudomonadota bacterium]
MKRYRISEIFHSVQGEGRYTGVPSLFLRFWGCNFQCRGFGSVPLPEVKVEHLTEFTVLESGCDTEYAWNPAYRHLSEELTADEICDRLEALVPSFQHPYSGQATHLVVTGGEPMLSQTALVAVLDALAARDNLPNYITIETNGTQEPRQNLADRISRYEGYGSREWFWSVSPKLSISGEAWDAAIRPEVVAAYRMLSNAGQLKFVVDGSDAAWDEVTHARNAFRTVGVDWDATIMPLGATRARLEETQAAICKAALTRGYHFSARLHAWLFDNTPGT